MSGEGPRRVEPSVVAVGPRKIEALGRSPLDLPGGAANVYDVLCSERTSREEETLAYRTAVSVACLMPLAFAAPAAAQEVSAPTISSGDI